MMYVTGLFKRVEHITKESVSSMTLRDKNEYLRELVITHLLNGDSDGEIAKKVLIPTDTL